MRIFNIVLIQALLFAGLSFAQSPPAFEFESKVYKFGKVPEDTVLTFEYHFTNTGDSPLVISDIKVTCGCTKPEWPRNPIPKGEKGIIKVTFDTKGKIAYQERTLDIISNAGPKPFVLKFKGVVDKKKKG